MQEEPIIDAANAIYDRAHKSVQHIRDTLSTEDDEEVRELEVFLEVIATIRPYDEFHARKLREVRERTEAALAKLRKRIAS